MKFITQLLSTLSIPAVSFAPACIVSNFKQELKWSGGNNVVKVKMQTTTSPTLSCRFEVEEHRTCEFKVLGVGGGQDATNFNNYVTCSSSGFSLPFNLSVTESKLKEIESDPSKTHTLSEPGFDLSWNVNTSELSQKLSVGTPWWGGNTGATGGLVYYHQSSSSVSSKYKSSLSDTEYNCLSRNAGQSARNILDSYNSLASTNRAMVLGASWSTSADGTSIFGQPANPHEFCTTDGSSYCRSSMFYCLDPSAFTLKIQPIQGTLNYNVEVTKSSETPGLSIFYFTYTDIYGPNLGSYRCPERAWNAVVKWQDGSMSSAISSVSQPTEDFVLGCGHKVYQYIKLSNSSCSPSKEIKWSGTAKIPNPLGE